MFSHRRDQLCRLRVTAEDRQGEGESWESRGSGQRGGVLSRKGEEEGERERDGYESLRDGLHSLVCRSESWRREAQSGTRTIFL